MMTPSDLKSYDAAKLELVYRSPYPQERNPQGIWKGQMLSRIDSEGGRNVLHSLWQGFLFDMLPYGLWFEEDGTGSWYFFADGFRVGEFTISRGKSRFRDTDCLRLTYDAARLPGMIKNMLYDELKWVSPNLILGLGALNMEKGQGDQFFFLLEQVNESKKF